MAVCIAAGAYSTICYKLGCWHGALCILAPISSRPRTLLTSLFRMNSAFTPLSLLTPLLLVLLGGGMLALWWRWRKWEELGWMGAGMASSGLGMLAQVLYWPGELTLYVLTYSVCYLAGVSATAQALALRLGVTMPWKVWAVTVPLVLGLQLWFSVVQPDLVWRVYIFTSGSMLVMAMPLWHGRRMVLHSRFDRVLRAVYAACIVLNLLRTVLLMPLVHEYLAEEFTRSVFWIALHFSALLVGVALCGCMLVAVGSGVIHALQQERHLDTVTGVLHHKGLQAWVRRQERRPAHPGALRWTLLLCELDRWPWVQPQWGAAAADHVLQVAAQLIQRHTQAGDVVARLEGGTFAVLQHGADMTRAMSVGEQMRREMALLRLPMLLGERVTLSMGIAPVQALDASGLAVAMVTARQLLSSAQQAGSNRVRSGPAPLPPPPLPPRAVHSEK